MAKVVKCPVCTKRLMDMLSAKEAELQIGLGACHFPDFLVSQMFFTEGWVDVWAFKIKLIVRSDQVCQVCKQC